MKKIALLGGLVVMFLVWVTDVQAIPAFARRQNMSCATCHTIIPELNETGRTYEQMGYVFGEDQGEIQSLEEDLWVENSLPISVKFKTYPLKWAQTAWGDSAGQDSSESSMDLTDSPHEVEIIGATRFSPYASALFEYEIGGGWEGFLNLHPFGMLENNPLSITLGHVSPFHSLIAPGHRITRNKFDIYETEFANGYVLGEGGTGAAFWGRPTEQITYELGAAFEGTDFDFADYFGRFTFRPISEFSLSGVFYLGKGTTVLGDTNSFNVYGPELLWQPEKIRLLGSVLFGSDDAGIKDSSYSFMGGFVEASYNLTERLVPGIRYNFQTNEDFPKVSNIVPYLFCRVGQNITCNLEYKFEMLGWEDLAKQGKNTKKSELTLKLEFAY